jgi:hypothetical protein
VRIERLLAAGASIQGAARKFAIDYHALRRHWRNHVSAEARAAYRDEFVCGIFLNKIIIPQNFSAVMTVFDLDTPALKWLKI